MARSSKFLARRVSQQSAMGRASEGAGDTEEESPLRSQTKLDSSLLNDCKKDVDLLGWK